MQVHEIWVGTITFGLAIWLGLYIIGREPRKLTSWLAGSALLFMGSSILLTILGNYAPTIRLALNSIRWRQFGILFAGIAWLIFLVRLIPNEKMLRKRLTDARLSLIVIFIGSFLFAISTILVLFPLSLSVFWGMVLSGAIFFVIGSAAAVILASEDGEALWPDYLRSLDYALFMALLFGLQVALVMRLATGVSFVMLSLLFGTILTAVIVQAFAMRLAGFVDQIAFFSFPKIRQERANLRATSEAAARLDDAIDLQKLSGDEFAKLTRRAISEMGNLPRLAASPLTQLPMIQNKLAKDDLANNTLAQANELKRLLKSCIERLKPVSEEAFGTTDEWRHYNALYFPYVVGLRPYRRYITTTDLSPHESQALNWFRAEVPTRTLYNWQQAGARLIAQDLREQARVLHRAK